MAFWHKISERTFTPAFTAEAGFAIAAKADIGIKNSRIAAIGKAGNPDTQPGVDIVIGPGTEIISCEGMVVTAGAIDRSISLPVP
mgnify:CR=1 FL=1